MMVEKCAVCGGSATIQNAQGMPVCSRHSRKKVAAPLCSECGLTMALRNGKFGSFWGCIGYPNCDGIKKL